MAAPAPRPAAAGCRGLEAARRIRKVAAPLAPLPLGSRPRRLHACARAPTTGTVGLHPPPRGRRRLTGLCGASPAASGSLARGRRVRSPGRDVTRRREPGAVRGGGVGPDPERPLAGRRKWAG